MKIKEIIRYAALGVLLIANGTLLNLAEAAKGDKVNSKIR